MASTPYVSALRSLNYRLEQFVSACSEPGITPHRLLSLLSDSQTARALLNNAAFLRASSDGLESLTGPLAGNVEAIKAQIRAEIEAEMIARRRIAVPQVAPLSGMTPLGVSPKAKATKKAKARTDVPRIFTWTEAVKLAKWMVGKSYCPIISGVHVMSDGAIEATDLDVSFRLVGVAKTNRPVCIGHDSAALCDGTLDVSGLADGESAWVVSSGAKVPAMDTQDYPMTAHVETAQEWATLAQCSASELRLGLQAIRDHITAEDARYFLAAALVGCSALPFVVGTDGHRLAAYGDWKQDCPRLLMPRHAVNAFLKLGFAGPITIQRRITPGDTETAKASVVERIVDANGNELAWKAIDGQFPAFEKVLACDFPVAAKVECGQALTWLRRFPGLRSAPISVSMVDGLLVGTMTSEGRELRYVCRAEKLETEGEDLIGANAYYLRDAIEACYRTGAGFVTIALRDADSQMVVSGGSVTAIVMPMRVK